MTNEEIIKWYKETTEEEQDNIDKEIKYREEHPEEKRNEY